MPITKNKPDAGSLFDSVLSAKEAFLKPPVDAFPPLIDPDVVIAEKIAMLKAQQKKKQVLKRTLLPKQENSAVTAASRALKEQGIAEVAYSYQGAKARKKIEWEGVAADEALPQAIVEDERNQLAVAAAKAQARRTESSPRQLNDRSKAIVKEIPRDSKPVEICKNFPHIMNLIAASWHEPKAFVKTLDELLMDERGGRQGFPFAIIVELTDLREYYFAAVRPESRKLWDRL
jgi:hypothetical protein